MRLKVQRVITGVALVLCLAWLSGCATVPLTGRKQLSLVPADQLNQMAADEYSKLLKESKLSTDKAKTGQVQRVGKRIAQAAVEVLKANGQAQEVERYQWEFNLVQDDKTVNAFCMPGGKVAVYTGILPICQNDQGLAVVMGHEVAHALANHGSERLSQTLLAQWGDTALEVAVKEKPEETRALFHQAYGIGAQIGVLLPYSRSHESEADHIGLMIMAAAGYDPHGAVGFWQRMQAQGGARPPEFLSTHPDPENRVQAIENELPEAMKYYRPVTP